MKRDIISPANREVWLQHRLLDVTSTEVSALFDESPYMTHFTLWHNKRDKVAEAISDNERMKWGRRLQDAIARGIAEDHGWRCEPIPEYWRIPEARMGASFDWRVFDADGRPGILEIKNVDRDIFLRDWKDDEAPAHIEMQFQQQVHITGYDWGAIAALVGGNQATVLLRERDAQVGAGLQAAIAKFWASIEAGTPPAPDFMQDADTIRRAYGFAEPGKLLDARGDERVAQLCAQYTEATAAETAAKEAKNAARSELLTIIGDHEKTLAQGFSISAAMRAGYRVEAYDVEPRRDFRITKSKPKGAVK